MGLMRVDRLVRILRRERKFVRIVFEVLEIRLYEATLIVYFIKG